MFDMHVMHLYICCRGKLLDASREENAVLVAELRELEDKVCIII